MPMRAHTPAPILFDKPLLQKRLENGEPLLLVLKETLKAGAADLYERFAMSAPADELAHQHTELVDEVLILAWDHFGLNKTPYALLAAGGYGRSELFPHSDVDLAILVDEPPEPSSCEGIEQFITLLWDLGLDIGHSVRTPDECYQEAREDITIITNIMEARLLTGNKILFKEMQEKTAPDSIWTSRQFFEAKLQEQSIRHHKFGNTAYKLEQNVKEGPGGLRDIQMVSWVAKRHFDAMTLKDLVTHEFLTEEECLALEAGQSFLWRVRYALHILAGRREDRLLFDYQRDVAELFGFSHEENSNSGIEHFMKMYYRTVMELSRLNEMLLQLFEEAILLADQHNAIEPLNERFQIRNSFIEVSDDNVFTHDPFALLEIFLLLQQHPEIKGVRASTIRLIRSHLSLINVEFRNDIRARSLFMEIIRHPRRMGHELQRMQRYGVLENYLPLFEAVTGQMQFDLFHIYTVDEHTLMVVRNLRRLSVANNDENLPYCTKLMQKTPKPELLYLAGLFHDIAKGRSGDHSTLGAVDAFDFCVDHGLSKFDSKLVAWLVKNHLLMSVTTTKKDISDPVVVNEFASLVGDKLHLDYLLLLTVADIRATNTSLWNSWKDALLTELHRNALRALRRGSEKPIDKQERISETQGEALAKLCSKPLSKEAIVALWESLGEDYFLRHQADEIAWHTQGILTAPADESPLIMLMPESGYGSTEIFIYSRDRDFLFAVTSQILDQLGLTVLDARIMTTSHDYALCTYNALEAATNKVIQGWEREDEILTTLKQELTGNRPFTKKVNRHTQRQIKQFDMQPTVSFSIDELNDCTLMEVTAIDQPGLLSHIGTAMRFCGARLISARVATFGERVEDIFYISDNKNQVITDPAKLDCLRESIVESLTATG